ncbi:MAG: pyrroloquinoline quinone precursor peptide PqqA [Pseudomonadota bacterium]
MICTPVLSRHRSAEKRFDSAGSGDNIRTVLKTGNVEEEYNMTWSTPKVVEISVGLEINAYVCAEL